jgi:hypothetical protein
MQSGELQILKLAKNGTMVKPGDVVVQFDPSTLQRTIQEKQSELKQADAEIEQAQAQTRIAREQNATAVMKAATTSSARSSTSTRGHGLAARQRAGEAGGGGCRAEAERELKEKVKSDDRPPRPTCRPSGASARRRCSICSAPSRDFEPGAAGARRRHGQRPAELPFGRMFGGQQEFRKAIAPGRRRDLELPDLSSVHLEARLDESDRGRLKPGRPPPFGSRRSPGRISRRGSTHLGARASISPPAGRRRRTSI